MDVSEDSAWVFDSLIGFLHGPVWNVPLQTFIEEKSLIFEPTDEGKICDKKEYLAIFGEYKTMVDLMLGSYMDDIGITPEQFEDACQMSKDSVDRLPAHFHRRLFEQIWAANDYSVFTRMMTQKNVELQLQALELIEQRSGIVPSSYLPSDENPRTEDEDIEIMEKIKQLSLEEANDDDYEAVNEETKQELVQEKIHLQSALENFQKNILMQEAGVSELRDASKQSDSFIESEKKSVEPQPKPQKEDVLQRQQYLKKQRDRLLALKRQIREKQLLLDEGEAPPAESGTADSSSFARPKSATAARMMLAGAAPAAEAAVRDSSLLLRRALAERLRAEVVEKS